MPRIPLASDPLASDPGTPEVKAPAAGRGIQCLANNPCLALGFALVASFFLATLGHIITGGPPATADVFGFNPRGTQIGDRDNTLQLLTHCPGDGNCCTKLLPLPLPDAIVQGMEARLGSVDTCGHSEDNSDPCLKPKGQTVSLFTGNSSDLHVVYGSRDGADVFTVDLIQAMCTWEAAAVQHSVNSSVRYERLCRRAVGRKGCCLPRTLPLVLRAALNVTDCAEMLDKSEDHF
jgi:hypothetical protein